MPSRTAAVASAPLRSTQEAMSPAPTGPGAGVTAGAGEIAPSSAASRPTRSTPARRDVGRKTWITLWCFGGNVGNPGENCEMRRDVAQALPSGRVAAPRRVPQMAGHLHRVVRAGFGHRPEARVGPVGPADIEGFGAAGMEAAAAGDAGGVGNLAGKDGSGPAGGGRVDPGD